MNPPSSSSSSWGICVVAVLFVTGVTLPASAKPPRIAAAVNPAAMSRGETNCLLAGVPPA
jgi:hypothetical protein